MASPGQESSPLDEGVQQLSDTGKPGRSEVHLILDRINESGRRSDIFSQIGRASVIRSSSTKRYKNPSYNRLICFRKSI